MEKKIVGNWITIPYERHDLRDPNYCSKCPLNLRVPITFVPFEIVGNNPTPSVMLVAESPYKEEMKSKRVLIGPAGSFLREILSGFLDEYSLCNSVSCHPNDLSKGPQAPDSATVKYCLPHVHQFIQQTAPKIVILLGSSAIKAVLPEPYKTKVGSDISSVGKMVLRSPELINGVLYACAYHPSFIIRQGGLKNLEECAKYRKRFENILNVSPETIVPKKYNLTHTCQTLDNLSVILRALVPYQHIGLDYEALDLDPFSLKNRVTGFSLSVVIGEGNRGRSYFISVDREPTEDERNLLLKFFKEKTIWTYNAKYEMNTTWSWLGQRIKFDDAFCLCKIDCSPTSLKLNSQKYLNSDLWEEDVYNIVSLYEKTFEEIKKLTKGFPKIVDALLSGDLNVLQNCPPDLDEKKIKKLRERISYLLEAITPRELSQGLQQYPYPWGAVPKSILGEYCSWDSFLTLKLKDNFWGKYSKQYPYYRSQTWLAGTMEAYGYNWDDTKAEELYQYYLEEAVCCLFELILRIDLDDTLKQDARCVYYGSSLSTEKLKKLKEIFNPLSNLPKSQAPFWKSYRTQEVETWAFFTYLEHEILQHEDLDAERFISVFDTSSVESTANRLYAEVRTKDEHKAITKILQDSEEEINLFFQRFAIEVTEFQYEAHTKYGKVDIDKQETWNEQFFMLYYLKRFKKVMKAESTYIRGENGRQNVSRSTYSKLTEPPKRIESYFDCENHTLQENERWILNTNFFENAVLSKRWSSKSHTVPANSELREIYTPRSPSAIIVHPDYSQNELRYLAALAQEENLLRVFESGGDIHRYVAAASFKKAQEDVTDEERRQAKAGCVSGDTLIKLLDGRTLPIKELSEEYEKNPKGYYTYSFDLITRTIKPGYISWCGPTKKEKNYVKITFKNGMKLHTLITTYDHRFLLKQGHYTNASCLKVGDTLLHGHTWLKHDNHGDYEMLVDPICGGSQRTHHIIGDHKGYKHNNEFVIHHKDHNTRNNAPNNLEQMTWEEHSYYHSSSRDLGNFIIWDSERRINQSLRLSSFSGEKLAGSVHYLGMLKKHLQYIRDLCYYYTFTKDAYNFYRPHHTFCLYEHLVDVFGLQYEELISQAFLKFQVSETPPVPTPTAAQNFSVVSIELINNETEELQFYDLTVDDWHNYSIEMNSEANGATDFLFTHNSFGIIFGESEVAFAQNMMKGDIALAHQFFLDFFSAFPGVRTYIEYCHRQVLRYGYVYTMFGDPLYIDQTKFREDEVLRKAQNLGIQGSASSLAAHAISILNEYFIRNEIQAIPLDFCHDAVNFEVELCDLLIVLDKMYYFLVSYIRRHFGVPVDIEVNLGIHQNHMMKIKLDKENKNTYNFSCPEKTFSAIISLLKSHFCVEYTIEKEEEERNSLAELFLSKRAFSKYLGETSMTYKGKLFLS